ncbi:DUF4097 family beta strand repeat-containing protein [Actinoplanes sp. CA-015351]|uniref:DUF4097 family beta strand repeat-containing protein n=1 Tax=Actinoplanes sp. CA-015351 TaxID=3239897 RepID=UPI003D964214
MHTFDTTAPITAVLDIPAGSIRFTAGDHAETTVEVLPADASKGRDVTAAEQTTVSYENGTLRIKGREAYGNPGSIAVTVQVPAGSGVQGKAAAADFRGSGRLGDVVFETAQGPIGIDEAASARLSVAAGDVTVGRLTGAAEISVAHGDIRITEAVRGAVVLRTQAGAISIGAAPGVSAALNAGTSYGRVDNRLKNDGSAELDIHATTQYGDIVAHSL